MINKYVNHVYLFINVFILGGVFSWQLWGGFCYMTEFHFFLGQVKMAENKAWKTSWDRKAAVGFPNISQLPRLSIPDGTNTRFSSHVWFKEEGGGDIASWVPWPTWDPFAPPPLPLAAPWLSSYRFSPLLCCLRVPPRWWPKSDWLMGAWPHFIDRVVLVPPALFPSTFSLSKGRRQVSRPPPPTAPPHLSPTPAPPPTTSFFSGLPTWWSITRDRVFVSTLGLFMYR